MVGCLALVRVRIPDRPGALGLVASRIGALKADIVGIEVIDRTDGSALDELAIVLPHADLIPALTREIDEVDGVTTESVTVVDELPEPRIGALRTAIALTQAQEIAELAAILVDHVHDRMHTEWCAAIGATFVIMVGHWPAGCGAPDDPMAIRTAASFGATVGAADIELCLGRDSLPSPSEQNLLAAYCALATALTARAEDRSTVN